MPLAKGSLRVYPLSKHKVILNSAAMAGSVGLPRHDGAAGICKLLLLQLRELINNPVCIWLLTAAAYSNQNVPEDGDV